MKRFPTLLVAFALLLPIRATSQQRESYDYWRFNRNMIQYGQQAILMCNGLFTSGRTLEQVFDQELAYLRQPVGTDQTLVSGLPPEIRTHVEVYTVAIP